MISLGSLHLELGTMLVQLIAFLILLWLVRVFAMKPAMKIMNDRQAYIENQISSAEQTRDEAYRLVEEQKKILADAKKEAYDLIESAKAQKEREASEILKAAQQRAERIIQEATAEIENEKVKAIAELRDQVGNLSVMLASKILEKELNAAQQQKMIDDFLKQVEGQL
ncbi:F0F1 ATP synthase subunit B [Ferviditalea candida]|uniref:ATP synthase subunit b n=1 Tax=Ferviditalea candida TaxID=3108399 RepID=A0ABU5ZJ40_9BACL|nr:F0F1 ATP synthase subunit B [Paenibacillaceae bacterium T2]